MIHNQITTSRVFRSLGHVRGCVAPTITSRLQEDTCEVAIDDTNVCIVVISVELYFCEIKCKKTGGMSIRIDVSPLSTKENHIFGFCYG